ncbi:hypothetical protein CYMTET_12591 [Cymbomonas tetramitiformis]|uniref:Uncharacterized protein n=1 Tax=Cymbomonas tetramitiformis TaxID=36881 RepID=A0AAE0GK04_9CHLO|nr:hypothetical protein CYMTET_12591 [Cymbomonas tetramitiformis]
MRTVEKHQSLSGDLCAPQVDVVAAVQKDWDHREFVEILRTSVQRLAEFLSNFDSSARGKLAGLNEKLTRLERKMEFVEAVLSTTEPRKKKSSKRVETIELDGANAT